VKVTRTISETRAAVRGLPRPVGFTPTMGALHEGHLSLVDAARQRCAAVVASVFVNPLQFGEREDLDRYPRDEARDNALLEARGVDVVFAPSPAEMYPEGFATGVRVGGPLAETCEGASRTGHFDGVALVVTKLLDIVQPDVLFLGQKDAQQLAVIRRLVRDLDLPVEVTGSSTVREPDGLAMSSRNAYLTPQQRAVAPGLYRSLLAGRAAAEEVDATPKDVIAATTTALLLPFTSVGETEQRAGLRGEVPSAAPRFDVDYVAVVDADTFRPETALRSRSLLVAAARLGSTRLIDNVGLAPLTPDPSQSQQSAGPRSSAYPAEDATD
jgi:pantoate--beta-alanine ligase